MLSQFKYNLRQAISCIRIHQQQLTEVCSRSLQPLSSYLSKILPSKLQIVFNSISSQRSYTSIQDFFTHLSQLGKDISQFPTPKNKNNQLSHQNLSSCTKSGFMSRRKTMSKRLHSLLEATQNELIGASVNQNQKQFVDIVFKQYAKFDGGAKRLASFAQKQLFKQTLNYHKIIKFLEVVGVKLLPDSRLKLMILIKKSAQDSNFVKKQQFQKMYKSIRNIFSMTEKMQSQFFEKHQKQTSTKKNLFLRKIDIRSQRRMSRITRLPSVHQSEKSSVKINPQKSELDKSFIARQNEIFRQNHTERDQQISASQLINLEQKGDLQKSSVSVKPSVASRFSRPKAGAVTWANLAKTKQESILNKNIKIPNLHLRTETKQDEYYLIQFYKTNGLHSDILKNEIQSNLSQLSPYKSLAEISTDQN